MRASVWDPEAQFPHLQDDWMITPPSSFVFSVYHKLLECVPCRSYLRIPASLQLLVAFTGLVVLYHHAPGPTGKAGVSSDNGLLEDELADPEEH